MNLDEFHILIDRCIAETITPDQHAALQTVLKQDPKARALFRERMDLEAALNTWARQSAPLEQPAPAAAPPVAPRWRQHPWAAAAALLILFSAAWMIFTTPTLPITPRPPVLAATLGSLVEQDDCTWASAPAAGLDGQLRTGTFRLQSGGAMLELDSGTTLLAEGPCEFELASGIEATLLRGNVTVHVTDASDGFVLRTPDATIIDEGTEYAVACDGDTTEVHVFDGSVIYYANDDDEGEGERIGANEARRFQRGPRGQGAKIPFGKREFLRRKGDHRFQPGRGFPKPPRPKPARPRGFTPEQKLKLHALRAKFKGHGDFKKMALDLSEEQHAKLGAARKAAEAAAREIEYPQERANAIRRSMKTAMQAILTDEQKTKLQKLREQQKRQPRDKPAPKRPNGDTPPRPREPRRPGERSGERLKPPRPEKAGGGRGPFPSE